MRFEARMTTRQGVEFTPDLGTPTVHVVVGSDAARPADGDLRHLHAGVWQYEADESEIGTWETVVILTAPDCLPGWDRHCGTVEVPKLPEGWDTLKSISRIDFLELVMGMKPRADYVDWLAMLVQSDPIPLSDRIKQGLARAYPHLIK